ncbi:MAG TPA: hypothetical protein VGK52_20255 [Polyangia bacterium]|jgi:hypothetical protein
MAVRGSGPVVAFGACALLALSGASCFWSTGTKGARAILPAPPSELGKCRVAASQSSPLVTEWPASEKSNLEVLSHTGGVAVAYSGCSLRVLPQCRVRGSYQWQRTTPSVDSLSINDTDDLYAKLPLGAASLEGELKRTGKLFVKTVVAGQLRLEGAGVSDVPADGACAQATHLVTALSVGAFSLTAGGERQGSVGASLTMGEAKVERELSAEQLRSAGDFDACGQSTVESPNGNCASPIQVFLTPLPGRAAEEGPPGTVKVDFLSANPAARWDVYSDDQVICTTPCARFVHPAHPVLLRARDDGFMAMSAPDRIEVPNLLEQDAAHLQLEAHPTARGQWAASMTFMSLTGMAVVTGLVLTPLGCSTGRDGMCTAGLITLGAGALTFAGSLWLFLDARPRAEIAPYTEGGSLLALPSKPGVHVAPGGLWGTF